MQSITKTISLITIAAFFAAIFVGAGHARAIEDWFKLRNYTPPASVTALTAQDTMTDFATHIFYVNHPDIDNNVTTFRQKCSLAEQTIVLGCYHSDQNGIEVYDVKDSRLSGVEQVTAAHEMLHAAYDRLSTAKRQKVDAMLEDYYKNSLTDDRIKSTIDSYKKTEPNDVVNEMHSVFGTEVAKLPAPLEEYYKQYFVDRSKVTAYAANYEGEFTSRKDQIDADDQQLSSMKQQIQAEEASLEQQLSALQADRSRVENSDSEAVVSQYNARVNTYNAGVHQLQNDIAAYNSLVEERNSIAKELESLQSSLDTRLTQQSRQ